MQVENIVKVARKVLKAIGADEYYSQVITVAHHDGSAHIENIKNGKYRFVYSERGKEYGERITDNIDDILYWIYNDATFTMASKWEAKYRIENQDPRILLIQKQLELLKIIDEKYAERREKEINSDEEKQWA